MPYCSDFSSGRDRFTVCSPPDLEGGRNFQGYANVKDFKRFAHRPVAFALIIGNEQPATTAKSPGHGDFVIGLGGGYDIFETGMSPHYRASPKVWTSHHPLLVLNGKPALNKLLDRSSVIRTAVGLRELPGQLIFVSSKQPVTLTRLEQVFVKMGVDSAIAFDGDATRLWSPNGASTHSASGKGHVVAFFVP